MRGVVGPVLTTGVALATAGVVVANPITATRADVQIPAVQLSAGSNDAVSMLDEDFLEAIDTPARASTNPFTLLRDLIATLAADATHVGKNAIMEAFVAGVTAVSEPELTTFTVPYLPEGLTFGPAIDTPTAEVFLLPGLDSNWAPEPGLAAIDTPGFDLVASVPQSIAESLTPTVRAVEEIVNAAISDVSYVGGAVVAAAFAAGAAVAKEPILIVQTLVALVNGDFDGALDKAVRAVTEPFRAPGIIITAVQNVLERRLVEVGSLLAPAPDVSPSSAGTPAVGAPVAGVTPSRTTVRATAPAIAVSTPAVVSPSPGENTAAEDTEDAAADGITAADAGDAAPVAIGAAQLRSRTPAPKSAETVTGTGETSDSESANAPEIAAAESVGVPQSAAAVDVPARVSRGVAPQRAAGVVRDAVSADRGDSTGDSAGGDSSRP